MAVSRMSHVRRNIRSGAILKLVTPITSFITRTAMIYTLGNMYLGLNSLFISMLEVLSLAELGFGSAMIFSMYKPIAENDEITVNALLRLYRSIQRIVGLVILGAGLLLIPLLPKLIKGEVPEGINLTSLYLIRLFDICIGYFMFAYRTCLIDASQRTGILQSITSLFKIILCAVQVAVLYLFRNYYVFCLVIPGVHLIQQFFSLYVSKRLFPQYRCMGDVSKDDRKDIYKRVTGLFLYKVSHVLRNSFDSIILSAFLGLEILAKYHNYYVLVSTLIGITSILTDSSLSSIGNSIALETRKKNYQDFCSFQLLFMGISIVMCACMSCIIQPFVIFWVKEENLLSDGLMLLFIVYFFTDRMGNICYQYRQAAGLWWEDRARPIVDGATNLLLNYLMVQYIGVAGVMLSTIFCHVVIDSSWGASILFRHYFKEEKQSHYIFRLLYFGALAALSCFVSMSICKVIPTVGGNRLISLVYMALRGVIASTVSIILLLVFCSRLPEYKRAKGVALKMLRRRI